MLDLDGSGLIDNLEEFGMLVTNLVFKLDTLGYGVEGGHPPDLGTSLAETLGEDLLPLDPVGFETWFCSYFTLLPVAGHEVVDPQSGGSCVHTAVPQQEKTRIEHEIDEDLQYAGKDTVVLKALQLKHACGAALLHAYVDSRSVKAGRTVYRHDARIFPTTADTDLWVDSWRGPTFPSSLVEEAYTALSTFLDEDEMPRSPRLRFKMEDYVYNFIVPFLRELFGRHFPATRFEGNEIQRQSYHTLQELVTQLHHRGTTPKIHKIAFEHALRTFQINPMQACTTAIPSRPLQFQSGFSTFCSAFGKVLGISDIKRLIGTGTRDLGLLLSADTIPGIPVSPQEIVWQLFNVIIDVGDELQMDMARNCLRVARGLLYLDDPHMPRQPGFLLDKPSATYKHVEKNWTAYMKDQGIKKLAPSAESLTWVQNKYVRLGACKVVVSMLSHPSTKVKQTALRFGSSCLQGGNRVAQVAILEELRETQNHEFFQAIHHLILECVVNMEQLLESSCELEKNIGELNPDHKSNPNPHCPQGSDRSVFLG